MKTVAYLVAGLAAVGIMIALVVAPVSDPTSQTENLTAPATSMAAKASSEPFAEPGSVTLEIPSMHCQFACYPRVKETLEKTGGVSEVALVDQPDPNTLTVKKVTVKYDAGFDVASALASLKQEGFDDAQQIQ